MTHQLHELRSIAVFLFAFFGSSLLARGRSFTFAGSNKALVSQAQARSLRAVPDWARQRGSPFHAAGRGRRGSGGRCSRRWLLLRRRCDVQGVATRHRGGCERVATTRRGSLKAGKRRSLIIAFQLNKNPSCSQKHG